MPVIVIWIGLVGGMAECHESMAVLGAPVVGVVQGSDPLVCQDAPDAIWRGAMHEVHFTTFAALTSQPWLIFKIKPQDQVLEGVLPSFWFVGELLECLYDTFIMARSNQNTR